MNRKTIASFLFLLALLGYAFYCGYKTQESIDNYRHERQSFIERIEKGE